MSTTTATPPSNNNGSAAATPTPSPRPSLNLSSSRRNSNNSSSASIFNGNTTTTGGTGGNTPVPASASQTRKNRAALREFYNLASAAPDPTSATSTSTTTTAKEPESETQTKPEDPLSALDEPHFSAQTFVSSTLSSSSAQELLHLLSGITSSALSLEGDKKALVYDNYSTLLVATGTISGLLAGGGKGGGGGGGGRRGDGGDGGEEESLVQVRAGSLLETGVGEIEKLVAEIVDGRRMLSRRSHLPTSQSPNDDGKEDTDRDTDIDTKNQHKDKDAEKRERQRTLVKHILAAPSRLKDLKQRGRDEEAEREYREVLGLLDRWDGVGGVGEVRRGCVGVMGR